MGLIKKTICPKCGQEYSVLRAECPYCGTRFRDKSARTSQSTDAVRKGTSAAAKAEVNTKWQLVFGACLVLAVIVAVIVLVSTSIEGKYEVAAPSPTPSETVTPTPTPTPTPEPTPTVESLTITFLGQPIANNQFSAGIGSSTQLGVSIYPVEIEGPVEWSSSEETIATVDDTGKVTAVGAGWVTIVARCYGQATQCEVLVH